MIAYVDSSVALRLILGQPGRLASWPRVETGVASALVLVECLRAVDRLRLEGRVDSARSAGLREVVFRFVETLEVVEVSRAVLARAAQPLPTSLGTLDALHLATALLWSETQETPLVLATHDEALAGGARASGLETIGV